MHRIETVLCDKGCQHVVKEVYSCDYCHGVISQVVPKEINWFGRLVARVQEYQSPLGTDARAIIRVVYAAVLAGGNPIELHFCCLSHCLEFLRHLPAGAMPVDTVVIEAPLKALSQEPIQEPKSTA